MWRSAAGVAIATARSTNLAYRTERKVHRYVKPVLRTLKEKQHLIPKDQLPNPRNTFVEWNQDAELYAFGKRLGEDFDADLLKKAFTHRSYIIQEETRQRDIGIAQPELSHNDNDELIEQGDKFISQYVQLYLETALPNFPVEGVTAIKNYLTTTEMLAHISTHLGTKDIILTSEYPVSENVLAKTFKAVVAALIESSGRETAAHFVRDFVIVNLNSVDVNELWHIEKPMEMLAGFLEKSGKVPEPRLIQATAKNTILACYRVGIYIDKKMFSEGYGEDIDIAKEMAAREGLKIFFGTQENMPPIDYKIMGIPNSRQHQKKEILG